jgi:hypothetical protein
MPLSETQRRRARSIGLAIVLWAFALATTTLLVGLWGRTVTNDRATLEAGAQAALGTDVVAARIEEWLAEAVAVGSSSLDQELGVVVQTIAASPEADRIVDTVAADLVAAALAPPGTEARLDVASRLEPIVPVVVDELASHGVELRAEELRASLAASPSITLSTEEQQATGGVARRTSSALTTVFGAGLAALVFFGSLALVLAEESVAMVRSLAIRLAVSAVTFVVFLRLGAWAMDPSKGRSPLAVGGSVLLASNHFVLLLVAAAGGGIAISAGVVIRRRRVAGGEDMPENMDTPIPDRPLVSA